MPKQRIVHRLKDDAPKSQDEPCPKCGTADGWHGPRYEPERTSIIVDRSHPSRVKTNRAIVAEHLQWTCRVCGYIRRAPVKDAAEGGQ